MRKRLMMLLVVAAMGVAVLAVPAAAGEVSGPPGGEGAEGDSTPIAGFWTGDGAGSICSFSGLNDLIEEEEPTQTQSYGTFVSHIMLTYEVSVQEAKAILESSPDNECNPNSAPWGNPRTG